MRHVAVQAQMRVEKYAAPNTSAQYTERRDSLWANKETLSLAKGAGKATNNHELPETTRFFQDHHHHHRPQGLSLINPVEHDENTSKQEQQSSNVAALEAMKRKMAADIQRQIELTK